MHCWSIKDSKLCHAERAAKRGRDLTSADVPDVVERIASLADADADR